MKKLLTMLAVTSLLAACSNDDENNRAGNVKPGNVQPNNATTNNTTTTNNASTNNVSTNNASTNNASTNNASTNNGTTVFPFVVTADGVDVGLGTADAMFDGINVYTLVGRTPDQTVAVTLLIQVDAPGTFACSTTEFVPNIDFNRPFDDKRWSTAGGDCSVIISEAGGFGATFTGSFTATVVGQGDNMDPGKELAGTFSVDVP